MPRVSLLSVAPVKGLALLHPAEVELSERGVVENRRFYLVDEHGRLFSGLGHGPFVRVRPAYDAGRERLALSFPDGAEVEGNARSSGETLTTDFYGRPVQGRVVEGPWGAALSAYAGKELRLVRPDRPGDACDVHPVTLLSDASVEELGRQAGRDGDVDGRRFRMLVALASCHPHEEDEWEGELLRIGDAVVLVGGPVPRCAVTTRAPSTGVRDLDTLGAIKAYRGLRDGKNIDFGVYATVVEPGRVRVGDEAKLMREG